MVLVLVYCDIPLWRQAAKFTWQATESIPLHYQRTHRLHIVHVKLIASSQLVIQFEIRGLQLFLF